jgi:hypothetical protein
MTESYTLTRLTEIEDSAPRFGFAETQEARFASGALETRETGVSHHRVRPNRRQAFAHRHVEAEEVYVVRRSTPSGSRPGSSESSRPVRTASR